MKTTLIWLTVVILPILPVARALANPAQKAAAPQRQGIIFVVNGSGDDTSITDNLGFILSARCLPLALHTIRWCQWARPAKDHKDYASQIQYGETLAAKIMWYRGAYPNEKIYVIGHSAGTHVILTAARCLPADSVDRIVLMASSVSQHHDLGPALRCSKGGVDSLWSPEDQVLDIGVDQIGNADRLPGQAAGLSGFKYPHPNCPDVDLYKKLRQYRWTEFWRCWGHRGGHGGFTEQRFLDEAVLPMMLANGNEKK